jgi:hypothetical protein
MRPQMLVATLTVETGQISALQTASCLRLANSGAIENIKTKKVQDALLFGLRLHQCSPQQPGNARAFSGPRRI